ncbi:hypothetical protein [uncultured Arthrobacter sp.]|uniref:hypothetical protein n=1 Tax=uncultured Arthrobacter sp. TaxID=114050 RepID=UPI002623A79B|nr:hypothetical protein [uncultured Arthrobacter sp.]
MTSEQHPPTDPAEPPARRSTGQSAGQSAGHASEPADTRGAVPADGQPTPTDRDRTPSQETAGDNPAAPPATTDAPVPGEPSYREVTVRRAPKIVPFMVLGAVLGFLAALVVAYTGPVDPTLTRGSVLGFFTVAFAVPGLLLAALLVLVIDRRSIRKAERARAERTFDDEA